MPRSSLVSSVTVLSLSTITAIPSIATIFSTAPASSSLSSKFLDEFPISTLPASSDSIPAPEPVYSAVTLMSGYFSIKLSDIASQSFSIEVEPASEMLPLRSAAASVASVFVSAVVSAAACVCAAVVSCVDDDPQPASPAAITAAAPNARSFLKFLFIMSSHNLIMLSVLK